MQNFIIGLIFGIAIQQILNGFTSLVLSFIEMIKSYFAVKTVANDHMIEELSKNSAVPKYTIGFTAGEEAQEDCDL